MLEITDIKKLFAVMQARYGHRWTSTFDDPQVIRVAVNEWHRELKNFSPEDLRRGIQSAPVDWPPTLPQFKASCRKFETAAHKPVQKALPPTTKQHNAVKAISDMRTMLSGKN